MEITAETIRSAREAIRGHVRTTPLYRSPLLSRACGCDVLLKCEYQQITGSFKERGAVYRLLRLTPDERARGVIAASAGNHALGLSYHGQRLGIDVTVVMPEQAPIVKVSRCRAYGAHVELFGDSFDAARAHARERSEAEGLCFVHGFEDTAVIEGQGTVGLELLEQEPAIDVALVPVGGGGLLAGIAVALHALAPEVRLIGVESESAPTLSEALEAGGPVAVRVRPSLADGLGVAQAGARAVELCRGRVSQVEQVSEPEIADAVVRLLEDEKAVVEGAGAVGVAYALRRPQLLAGKRVAIVLSGGNIDMNMVSRIIERGLAAAGRLCRFNVELEDHPGALARLLGVVSGAGANVLQIQHDRSFAPADVAKVSVTLVLETSDHAHVGRLRDAFAAQGFPDAAR
ncbi:MAG TPA: threonine ammonia-lyase [Polyangiaceae bacterium]